MSLQKPIPIKIFLAILSCSAWFALIPQFFIIIKNNPQPWYESVTRYFSYFTLLSNGMVAVCSTTLLIAPNSSWGRFFARTGAATAIAVYITIVALIYNLVLRKLAQFEGLQKILNEVQHVIVPVLFVLYWCVFVNKSSLHWKDFLPWLWYPLIYILFILLRGSFSGFYPYPFIDMAHIGFRQTLINAIGMGILFSVMSLAFIGIGKLWSRKK